MIPKEFLELFDAKAPGLIAKEIVGPSFPGYGVAVAHRLGAKPSKIDAAKLAPLRERRGLAELCEFYAKHDGAELCVRNDGPLLKLQPIGKWGAFTATYKPRGEWDWTIDLNKSAKLYRGGDPWIAFARVEDGPSCLTTFLKGPNEGQVFFVTPQPKFNILRPIAKSFGDLLRRIATDLPAFLRLCRAYVTFPGSDGQRYGLPPVEYVTTRRGRREFQITYERER